MMGLFQFRLKTECLAESKSAISSSGLNKPKTDERNQTWQHIRLLCGKVLF